MNEALLALREGCYQKQLPQSTARELIRFLLVKKFMGSSELSDGISPSSKIDTLQHWTLLNTDVRKLVEAVVGEISHSEKTANLPEWTKVERRLAAMNAFSREGWSPNLELWREAGTLMHTILAVTVRDSIEDDVFSMYYVPESKLGPGAGQDKILELLNDSRYDCSEEDKAGIRGRERNSAPKRNRPDEKQGERHLVIIRRQDGSRIHFDVARPGRVKVQLIMSKIEEMTKIEANSYQLSSDGSRCNSSFYLHEYLDWGSPSTVIDLILNQVGC